MIVIPMAGMSRRFTEAGYDRPKYMLPVRDQSLFALSVRSFERYFADQDFLFVYRDIEGTDAFVREEAQQLGIDRAAFVPLDAPTGGQAETVAIGLERARVDPAAAITIFNIDTIRPDFRFPAEGGVMESAGYLEVFRGSGDNWSFVGPMPDEPGRAARTTEKDPDLGPLQHRPLSLRPRRIFPRFLRGGAAGAGYRAAGILCRAAVQPADRARPRRPVRRHRPLRGGLLRRAAGICRPVPVGGGRMMQVSSVAHLYQLRRRIDLAAVRIETAAFKKANLLRYALKYAFWAVRPAGPSRSSTTAPTISTSR
ncbi:MAG: hypothetical protein WDN24_13230 [Sphingomonas sp.]